MVVGGLPLVLALFGDVGLLRQKLSSIQTKESLRLFFPLVPLDAFPLQVVLLTWMFAWLFPGAPGALLDVRCSLSLRYSFQVFHGF